jgi:hypothetical protein
MKIEELRIGNLIGLNLKEFPDNIFKVLEVGQTMKVTDCWRGKVTETAFRDFRDFEPIPFNDKWKKLLGFYPDFGTYGGHLSPVFGGGSFRVKDGIWQSSYRDVEVKYVHQAQNLFYILADKELKISK